MTVFRYIAGDEEAESLSQMSEASLLVSLDELSVMVEFLQYVKAQLAGSLLTPNQPHLHLRDFWDKWTPADSDLSVVYGPKKRRSTGEEGPKET